MEVLKFTIPYTRGTHKVNMPDTWQRMGDVQVQHGSLVFWCLADRNSNYTNVNFQVSYTGDRVEMWRQHMGTTIKDDLVYHVFEMQP